MTYEGSEDMAFRLSRVESLVKGFLSNGDLNNLKGDLEKSMQGLVKTVDLTNLQTQRDERMEENGMKIKERMGHMEDNIERIVKLLQHQEENIPKEDDVIQGTHEDKNNAHVELPSTNKHDLGGFDSNMGSNQR